MELTTMHLNTTTSHISPSYTRAGLSSYILIPFVLCILTGCAVAMAIYIRRKIRLDQLRHRLIPLYSYDAGEQEDWDYTGRDEEEELAEPLYKDGKLSLTSGYGT
ncbi:small integral membrane protein 29-like [Myripristis murdjan]|uniref:small integral membrane protein 29-like n=1 Tax=Myripristis murdjan TaxID=586833 RepID=UPI001175E29C|nr:small integral membrane protein 29-like [Myripristis murdjan]